MIAYLDLPSGLSGDMFLGCLVDAGLSLDVLADSLSRLGLPAGSWSLRAEHVMRGPIAATLVSVDTTEDHHHRGLHAIQSIIEAADLPDPVRANASATFARLAEVEAKMHGVSMEQIHFHEVGALDAIVDVVGAAIGLHALGIDELYASPVPLGAGWTQSDHGPLPLPAPATLELLAGVEAPTLPAPGPGEHVTPTGAALLAQVATFRQPAIRLNRIGYGAGQRERAWPNVARLWLGEPNGATPRAGATPTMAMVQIDTNIDDMNPELYQSVCQHLFAAGARDVWLTPIQMKKGRPAVALSALAPVELEAHLADLMLRETTTLGVRVHPVWRHEAKREFCAVETRYGSVRIKLKCLGDAVSGAVPEFEDCQRLAEAYGVPTRFVYDAAQARAYEQWIEGTP
jgi:hypothetical protein